MKKDYTIGLDIGNTSTGYAAIYPDYTLVGKKMAVLGNTSKKSIKKNLWGARLYESANTAEGRRLKRTGRRRYTRRKYRLKMLREIFESEINKIDPNFFMRLDESFIVADDKQLAKHPIFANYEDEKKYHHDYPTIYHLRKKLVDSTQQVDIRLVYLALAHIMKNRGNFLIEGTLQQGSLTIDEFIMKFANSFDDAISFSDEFMDEPISEMLTPNIVTKLSEIMQEKTTKQEQQEKMIRLFKNHSKTGLLGQFIKLITGGIANFKTIFKLDDNCKIQFSKESFEDDLEELVNLIGDNYTDAFLDAKAVHDKIILLKLIKTKAKTNAPFSASMVERYENHKKDLEKLKQLIKKNRPEIYHEFFYELNKHGYAWYIDGNLKGADKTKFSHKQEAFYKCLETIISKMNLSDSESVAVSEDILNKIEMEDYLKKQRTYENGVIPHQIHLAELQRILENQGVYYQALSDNRAKIEKLFEFRIPYFIGPLASGQSEFSWIVKNNTEKITPWNFDEVVDKETSAQKFIEKMTNYDTYLPMEKVLPKKSILYQKFAIFNELTKVTYRNEQQRTCNLSAEEKTAFFNGKFKTKKTIKVKDLEEFFKLEYQMDISDIRGVKGNFNASFSTYQELSKIEGLKPILDDEKYALEIEKVIKILTIFEDRKMIKSQLKGLSIGLDEETINKLSRKKYTGWGRLSLSLINGIRDSQTQKTILDYLINDDATNRNLNRNFMQLINDDSLSFKSIINDAQKIKTNESLAEMVAEIPGSPAIKKGILQSIKVVDEMIDIMGYQPKNIVIEIARENLTTKQGTKSSKPRLNKLKESLKEFGSQLAIPKNVDNKALQSEKLFLYYLQDGKDMYADEPLDLDSLSNYEVDHIIPQSFIKDDSISNKVLTRENSKKGDNVPSEAIVKKNEPRWRKMLKAGLINDRKYNNLTKSLRGGLTADDKAIFIKRQLVETRQITKHVAKILDYKFNISEEQTTNIIMLKSSLTTQFRKLFEFNKSRDANDVHHAHDAYLNCVVATTLLKKYPKLKKEFVYGEFLKRNNYIENKATVKKELYSNIMKFFENDQVVDEETGEVIWHKTRDLKTITRSLSSHQINISKKVEVQKSEFSKESILPRSNSDKLIPRKNNWDPKKYGGLSSPKYAYTVLFEYMKKQKITKELLSIPVQDCQRFEADQAKYLAEEGHKEARVLARLPKYSLFESSNGYRRLISSDRELQKGNQMLLDQKYYNLLYHAARYDPIDRVESSEYVDQHRSEFDELFNLVIDFAKKYTDAKENVNKLEAIYEANRNTDDLNELSASFINLMKLNAFGAPSTFKFFGESIDRARYTSKIKQQITEGTLIYQSVTGLYETRIKLGG